MDTVLLATFPYTPQGQKFMPEFIEVSWVSLHPRYLHMTMEGLSFGENFIMSSTSYTKATGEYDVAVIGTFFSLEFTEYLAPMCLYRVVTEFSL